MHLVGYEWGAADDADDDEVKEPENKSREIDQRFIDQMRRKRKRRREKLHPMNRSVDVTSFEATCARLIGFFCIDVIELSSIKFFFVWRTNMIRRDGKDQLPWIEIFTDAQKIRKTNLQNHRLRRKIPKIESDLMIIIISGRLCCVDVCVNVCFKIREKDKGRERVCVCWRRENEQNDEVVSELNDFLQASVSRRPQTCCTASLGKGDDEDEETNANRPRRYRMLIFTLSFFFSSIHWFLHWCQFTFRSMRGEKTCSTRFRFI